MITATAICLYNPATNQARTIFARGEYNGRRFCPLVSFMRKHSLELVSMVGYQQETFAQSKHYHLTGEAI